MYLNIPKMATFISILLPIWAFSVAHSATTHAAAPSPSLDCSSLMVNLFDCLSFVQAGSTTKKPEGSCCNGLKTVLKTNADCLCEGFKNSANLGVALNVTKALTLPSVCHLSAPSFSNCGLSLVPAAAPALSPMPSSPTGAPTTSFGSGEVSPALPPAGISGSIGLSVSAGSVVLSLVAGAALTMF